MFHLLCIWSISQSDRFPSTTAYLMCGKFDTLTDGGAKHQRPNCQSHVTFFVDLSNYVSRHVSHQTQSRLSDQAVLIKYKLGFCWSIVYFPPQMFSETQFLFTFVTRPLFFMLYHRLNQPVGVAHCHITHFELLWLVVGYILLFWLTEGHFLFALIGYRLIRLCPGAFWSASVDYTSSKS